MALFKDMLGSSESVFQDTIALDYDYLPKILPYRDVEQRRFASSIKPLFNQRAGRNLFVYGAPGIGKTAACKHVLKELEEETDDILPIYINCWKHDTTFKIVAETCNQLGYNFTHNKKTSELFDIAKNIINKKSAVFIFDEIDKAEDYNFLYLFLNEIYRQSIFLITNYKEQINEIDERIKSRLNAEMVEFKPYNEQETKGILKHRLKYAFAPNTWNNDAFDMVAKKTYQIGDIRTGLYIMREAGNLAEDRASRKITIQNVEGAIKKSEEFTIKNKDELEEGLQKILELIKNNSGEKIGDMHKAYLKNGGTLSYKSFQRRISKLSEDKFITTEKKSGQGGNTTIVYYESNKQLTEF